MTCAIRLAKVCSQLANSLVPRPSNLSLISYSRPEFSLAGSPSPPGRSSGGVRRSEDLIGQWERNQVQCLLDPLRLSPAHPRLTGRAERG